MHPRSAPVRQKLGDYITMMDQVSITTLTGCIYKYGPIKNIEKTLNNTTLGFGSLGSFNDAYESEFGISHFFHSLEDEKKLLQPIRTPLDHIQRLSKKYLDAVRVTCFSRTPTNNLMWAHYANNHKGVCYAFNFINQKPPFKNEEIAWGGVIYSSYIPEIKIYQDQTTEGMLPSLLSDVILTKSQEWSYEEEVRFFHTNDDNVIEYKPGTLKAIILGRRVNDTDRTKIQKLVDKFNKIHKTNVHILYAHRITRTYSLGVHSNEGFQKSSETSFSAKIPVLKTIRTKPLTTLEIDNKEELPNKAKLSS